MNVAYNCNGLTENSNGYPEGFRSVDSSLALSIPAVASNARFDAVSGVAAVKSEKMGPRLRFGTLMLRSPSVRSVSPGTAPMGRRARGACESVGAVLLACSKKDAPFFLLRSLSTKRRQGRERSTATNSQRAGSTALAFVTHPSFEQGNA